MKKRDAELEQKQAEAFLDAAEVMWRVTDAAEGAAKYGASFRPIDYFVTLHAKLAGDPCCDHMHDGMGFLTQHVALTNMFEVALQSVSPRLAVPTASDYLCAKSI